MGKGVFVPCEAALADVDTSTPPSAVYSSTSAEIAQRLHQQQNQQHASHPVPVHPFTFSLDSPGSVQGEDSPNRSAPPPLRGSFSLSDLYEARGGAARGAGRIEECVTEEEEEEEEEGDIEGDR